MAFLTLSDLARLRERLKVRDLGQDYRVLAEDI
jgi:hypothetical protein